MANSRICSIPDCSKRHLARGWCSVHYTRWRIHGSPQHITKPTTPKGEVRRYFSETVLPYDGDECLIWPYSRLRCGYGNMRNKGKVRIVSRIVCEASYGPPPTPDFEAAHSCGRGHEGCVAKNHLSWKTPTQNSFDRLEHGTFKRGEQSGGSKLTETDIREIRSLKGTRTLREIANRFGITRMHVHHILKGRYWGWLSD